MYEQPQRKASMPKRGLESYFIFPCKIEHQNMKNFNIKQEVNKSVISLCGNFFFFQLMAQHHCS